MIQKWQYEYRCESCKWWNGLARNRGQCRKHSPKVILDGYEAGNVITTAWPETNGYDFCDDHEGLLGQEKSL